VRLNFVLVVVMICAGISGCSSDKTVPKETKPQQSQSSSNEQKETNKGNNGTAGTENKPGQPNNSNTSSDKTAKLPEGVVKRTFNSKEEAAASISGYQRITETNMDLGHNIKAFAEGAAGHQFISWNEGRWLIRVDYPNDLQYAAQKGIDGETFAKSVVNYLEKYYLPAPGDKGIIKIGCFKNSPQTLIQWQENNIVYEIKSDKNNPLETIHKAVETGQAK
jgi:uncharacterized protein YceK